MGDEGVLLIHPAHFSLGLSFFDIMGAYALSLHRCWSQCSSILGWPKGGVNLPEFTGDSQGKGLIVREPLPYLLSLLLFTSSQFLGDLGLWTFRNSPCREGFLAEEGWERAWERREGRAFHRMTRH